MKLLIKEKKNHYDCKFILILFRQTLTMFQTVASLVKQYILEMMVAKSLHVRVLAPVVRCIKTYTPEKRTKRQQYLNVINGGLIYSQQSRSSWILPTCLESEAIHL